MEEPRPLVWTDWPAGRMPERSTLAGLVILAALVTLAGVEPWLVPVAALVLVGSTSEVLLPTRYEVDAEGARASRLLSHRHLPWPRVAGVETLGEDLMLRSKGARPWLARRHDLRLRRPPPAVVNAVRERTQ